MSSTTNDAEQSSKSAARRVASIAADLRRHRSSATFVASSIFLALNHAQHNEDMVLLGFFLVNRYRWQIQMTARGMVKMGAATRQR